VDFAKKHHRCKTIRPLLLFQEERQAVSYFLTNVPLFPLFNERPLVPPCSSVIREEWLRPSHNTFNERNKWSFFNAVTEALKSTPPISIMEKHVKAYQEIVEE
jgi:hypothetical protein